MARDFNGSTQYGVDTTVPLTGYPFTMAIRFNNDITSGFQTLVSLGSLSTGDDHYLSLDGNLLRAVASSGFGANGSFAYAGNAATAGQWHSAVGRFASATSVQSILDANFGSAGSSSTNVAFGAPDTFTFGAELGAGATFLDGKEAEFVVWNIVVPDWVVVAYHKGVSPLLLLPQNIVKYAPMHGRLSPEKLWKGSGGITLTGSPAAYPHPPTVYPSDIHWHFQSTIGRAVTGAVSAGSSTVTGAMKAYLRAQGAVQAQASSVSGALRVIAKTLGAVQAGAATVTGTLTRTSHVQGDVQAGAATVGGALTAEQIINTDRFRRWWIGLKLRYGHSGNQAPTGGVMWFEDTFTEASDTLLAAHTSDSGHGWVEHPNFATDAEVIASEGRVHGTSTGATSIYYVNQAPPAAEYDVEAILRFSTNNTQSQNGLIARASTSQTTFYYAFFSGTAVQILRFVNGTSTIMASASFSPTLNTDYTVRFEIRDAAKTVYINGAQAVTTNDNTITDAGRIGLAMRSLGRLDEMRAFVP